MENYYNILEISTDSDPAEIKKAYFSMVRKYPPDKEPERFKEVREAYEFLQSEENRKLLNTLLELSEDVRSAYAHAYELAQNDDIIGAIEFIKNELCYYPHQSDLRHYLGMLYLSNDEPGKALKVFESLYKDYPDNIAITSSMAIACYERSYCKKALTFFEKAYNMGNRDSSFLLYYSKCCHKQGLMSRNRELLIEIISLQNAMDINTIQLALVYLIINDKIEDDIIIEENYSYLDNFIERYIESIDKYHEMFVAIYDILISRFKSDRKYHKSVSLFLKRYKKLFKVDQVDIKNVEVAELLLELSHFTDENNTDYFTYYLVNILTQAPDEEEIADRELEIIGCKLKIIDHIQDEMPCLALIKERYPLIRNLINDFILDIEEITDNDALWRKYEKLYCSMAGYSSDSTLIRDNEVDMFDENGNRKPFVKEEESVGRNDPCPCGSGKKYKKCCGR